MIHTVGPIANGRVTAKDSELLASSYENCYRLAKENGLRSIAYCCISTGIFGFPHEAAAKIAIEIVSKLQTADPEPLDVIFNVFLDRDREIYERLL